MLVTDLVWLGAGSPPSGWTARAISPIVIGSPRSLVALSKPGLDHDAAFGIRAPADPASGPRTCLSRLHGRSCLSESGRRRVRGQAPLAAQVCSHGCRSMPILSVRVQAVHPDPADEPRTNDQEGLTASGDQASDLDFLVAGAGFEPATSGL